MPRERPGFRENLADILAYTGGRRLLSVQDVKQYTGLADARTVKKRYPITGGYISAPTLALHLAGGGGP